MEKYDCIVMGGGWGGMAFALLNAISGKKTALFECYNTLGGYGHSFEREGYQFCANMHYFFATHPGDSVSAFLKRIKLEDQIEFNSLDRDGFDIVKIDDFNFSIPSNLKSYQLKLEATFPETKAAIQQLFTIRESIELITRLYADHEESFITCVLEHPTQFLTFSKFFLRSSSAVLDDLNIQGNLRAILLARAGNFGLLSSDIPLLFLLLEMTFYTKCATYPKLGMGDFIAKVQQKLCDHGVNIQLNNEIKKINYADKKISSVIDQSGQEYTADLFVSNMDPQLTFQLCDYAIPKKYRYKYTYSCFSLYLGLKNIRLEDFSLGNFNIWYWPNAEVDKNCEIVLKQLDYASTFLFISTPSAHVAEGVLAKPNSHTMQVVVPANYELIAKLYRDNPQQYTEFKEHVKQQIIEKLAEKFIPAIHDYIEVSECWSPVDLVQKVKTPCGAMYGMQPNKRKIIWPLGFHSPFSNLYFVGASVSHPGLGPVINGAVALFDYLQTL